MNYTDDTLLGLLLYVVTPGLTLLAVIALMLLHWHRLDPAEPIRHPAVYLINYQWFPAKGKGLGYKFGQTWALTPEHFIRAASQLCADGEGGILLLSAIPIHNFDTVRGSSLLSELPTETALALAKYLSATTQPPEEV